MAEPVCGLWNLLCAQFANYTYTQSCVHARPKQASLIIDFLIIGGGLAGLASAIALRRVGHRVTVLERNLCINSHVCYLCHSPVEH